MAKFIICLLVVAIASTLVLVDAAPLAFSQDDSAKQFLVQQRMLPDWPFPKDRIKVPTISSLCGQLASSQEDKVFASLQRMLPDWPYPGDRIKVPTIPKAFFSSLCGQLASSQLDEIFASLQSRILPDWPGNERTGIARSTEGRS